jgi:hypothetical protein
VNSSAGTQQIGSLPLNRHGWPVERAGAVSVAGCGHLLETVTVRTYIRSVSGFRSPEERALWEAMCAPATRVLDVLERKPTGVDTIAKLSELRAAPLGDLDAFRVAGLWSRCQSWLAAQVMVAQADCAGRLGEDTSDWPRVRCDISVDLTTYLGLTCKPGELAGYGPITAETARELSQDAQLRRLLTDPVEGVVVDVGRSRYRPSRRRDLDQPARTHVHQAAPRLPGV